MGGVSGCNHKRGHEDVWREDSDRREEQDSQEREEEVRGKVEASQEALQ
jgi:hypothetical protein